MKKVAKAPVKKVAKAPVKVALKTVGARLSGLPAKPKKPSGPALAASTLERLAELLEEERDRHYRQAEDLQAEADALATEREQGDTQFDEESGEGDTVSVERERDLALSASARQTVEEIERALERMTTRQYGYCEICGDRIPVARLELIPWAQLCVKCKSRGERRR